MLICDDPKFCFIHIPHSAGTSMRHFLKDNFDTYELHHKHAPASFLDDTYENYYKFAIVRNHLDWFKSMFAFMFKNKGGVYHFEWDYIKRNNPTFPEFINWYMRQDIKNIQETRDYYNVNNNLGGIFHWVGKNTDEIDDYLVFQSGMFQRNGCIEEVLGCKLKLPHVNRNTKGYKKKTVEHTKKSMQIIQDRYTDEINYFNFKKPNI